ncbi:MAG: SDR family NAD(P)-dependent oxidoreductase [Actinomycetota bacterium]|nr:SDR family NAD(P)-dependent oxidoreductase [Actinomycetota bacterium]
MPLALVTGASSGIGRATAVELARKGFHIVASGRSEERMAQTLETIAAEGGTAEFLHLDLASLDSAREAARVFEKTGRTLDVLVNNAGIGATRGVTADGFEIHFGVNHLGHFMLTHHLRRTFRPGTRIVQVTSSVHFRAEGIDFDRLQRKSRSFYGLREYAVSKLANVLFVREMARMQPDWRIYAVHPGLTYTNILPPYARPFMRRRLLTPEQGADTVIWCATSSDVADESGMYYARRKAEPPSPAAQDDDLARELWKRSEIWCGVAPQH